MKYISTSELDYDTVVVEPTDCRLRPVLYKHYQYSVIGTDDLCSVLEVQRIGELEPTATWAGLRHLPKARSKTDILSQFCLIELGHYEPK